MATVEHSPKSTSLNILLKWGKRDLYVSDYELNGLMMSRLDQMLFNFKLIVKETFNTMPLYDKVMTVIELYILHSKISFLCVNERM